MTELDGWPELISTLDALRRSLREVDPDYLWEYVPPRTGCSEIELAAAERLLSYPLDPGYRRFLRHCNGWPNFFLGTVLFGLPELLGAEYAGAVDLLAYANTGEHDLASLYPFAGSSEDIDIMTITGPSAPDPGRVVWFAGYEVESFSDFRSFFKYVMDAAAEDLARGSRLA